jgi:hypothetical protein
MAENTKTPPNQDQRQRTPQGGDPNKQQKPGGSMPSSNPDRSRQGMNNPNKPEIDQDRDRQSRKPTTPGSKDGVVDADEIIDDDDESTQRMDRD